MDPYRAANKALWNEWADIHVGSAFYDVEAFKSGRPGGERLKAFELEEIGDVTGNDLLHLQCHFGLDTLSWARRGAHVTGADFSERAIGHARALAAELGIEARFVCSDVLELPAALEGDFDVVYTSFGVLGWLPDLRRWAEVVAHFLRPGGAFYLAEFHPFVQGFDDEPEVTSLQLRYRYFSAEEPLEFAVQGSYADPAAEVRQPVGYAWVHPLGEVVTVLAEAGLRIEFLREYPYTFMRQLPFMEEGADHLWRLPGNDDGKLPLFYFLKATKPRP